MFSTGIDIIKVSRIKEIIDKKQDSFYKKIFTEREIEYIVSKGNDYKTVAGLFAAKEAVSKVIGTGIGKLSWKDMEILHTVSGKPYIQLSKKGQGLLNDINLNSIEITISHEEEYAIAFAIGHHKCITNIPQEVKSLLPERQLDSHKGTYGKVGIVGGSSGMCGSVYLASTAALKCGSGLVYSIVDKELEQILSTKFIEVIVKGVKEDDEFLSFATQMDGLNIGPGFGTQKNKKGIVKTLLRSFNGPIVLDADGINCIADEPNILMERKNPTIITPHPGELARLLGVSTMEIQNNRIYYSKYTSDKYNVIILLKGHETVVAYKDKIYINKTGNPGMATAGSGDILGGMIISFICQGISPFDSCVLGAYSHGLAGDIAKELKGEHGLIARDILENIPEALLSIKK